MEVVINGEAVEYTPDYPRGWIFISNDRFKFPVTINNQNCFIKRFETRGPADISGWQLLQNLKGKSEPNLPKVFDTKEVVENENDIAYVFYECLEGKSLEQMLKEPDAINLRRITYDIFKAMEAIHKHGFWFPDFCEKNIFCENSGRYVFVDLDSAQPLTTSPANDMRVSNDYWIPVYKFYKEVLNKPKITLSDINGLGLNYLQIIFLILHLKIFKERGQGNYRPEDDYNMLSSYLNKLDEGFQTFFTRVLQRGPGLLSTEIVIEIRKLIEEKIIKNTMDYNTGASKGAIIYEFSSSSNVVRSGDPFTLTWNVDADKIDLHRNGLFFQTLGASQRSIERTEFHDSDKDVIYELVAYKDGVQSKSKPLIIKSAASAQLIDPSIAGHLSKAVPWALFNAIVGIVFCTITIIIDIVAIQSQNRWRGSEIGLAFIIIVTALLLLFPMIFLLRFAIKMKTALTTGDNNILIDSFKNIKKYFVYTGITIIFLLISFLIILTNN